MEKGKLKKFSNRDITLLRDYLRIFHGLTTITSMVGVIENKIGKRPGLSRANISRILLGKDAHISTINELNNAFSTCFLQSEENKSNQYNQPTQTLDGDLIIGNKNYHDIVDKRFIKNNRELIKQLSDQLTSLGIEHSAVLKSSSKSSSIITVSDRDYAYMTELFKQILYVNKNKQVEITQNDNIENPTIEKEETKEHQESSEQMQCPDISSQKSDTIEQSENESDTGVLEFVNNNNGLLKFDASIIMTNLENVLTMFDNVPITFSEAKHLLQICHDKESDYQHDILYAGWSEERKAAEAKEYEIILNNRKVLKNFIELYGNVNYFVNGETYKIFKEKINITIDRIKKGMELQSQRIYSKRHNPEDAKSVPIKNIGEYMSGDFILEYAENDNSERSDLSFHKTNKVQMIPQSFEKIENNGDDMQQEESHFVLIGTIKTHCLNDLFRQSTFFTNFEVCPNKKTHMNEFYSRYIRWVGKEYPDIKPAKQKNLSEFMIANGYNIKRQRGFEYLIGYKLLTA